MSNITTQKMENFIKYITTYIPSLKVVYVIHITNSLEYAPYLPNENFSILCYSPIVKNNIIKKFPSIDAKKIHTIPIYSYIDINLNINNNNNNINDNVCLIMIGVCKYINRDILNLCHLLKKNNIDLLIFDPNSNDKKYIYAKMTKNFDNIKIYYKHDNNQMYTTIFNYRYKILLYDYKYTDRVSGSVFLSYFLKIPILANKIYKQLYTHMGNNIIYYDKLLSETNKYIKLIYKIKYVIDNYDNIINTFDPLKEDNYECINKLF